MRRLDIRVALAVGAAVALVLVVVLLVAGGGRGSTATTPLSTAPAEGIAARSPAPRSLPSPPAGSGCITASRVQLAGRRADTKQQYVLTLVLATAPEDEAGLSRLLATPDCAAAQGKVIGEVDHQLSLPPGDPHLTVTYLTPSGGRVFLPAG